jgi:hypothetical protein
VPKPLDDDDKEPSTTRPARTRTRKSWTRSSGPWRPWPELRFPIDVTFPGENEPDQVDAWISAYAEPFYIRA